MSQVFATHVGEGFDDATQTLFIAGDFRLALGAQTDQEEVWKQALIFENSEVDRIYVRQELLRFSRHPAMQPMEPARGSKNEKIGVGVKTRVVERLLETTTESQERLGRFG
jgi:hypothetical protein